MKNSIFACQNPVQQSWQLGHLPVIDGSLVLIGWRIFPEPIDAGVPEEVALILARAMTSAAQVIFPSSAIEHDVPVAWKSIGDDQICTIKTGNSAKRIWNFISNKSSEIVLISTRKPETAANLFDDAAFPWWMQGQLALLSDPEQKLPDIDEQKFNSLFENDWTQHVSFLQNNGIKCILRPGVDGDLAGFLFFTETFKDDILRTIENESRFAGFDWQLLSESEFAQSLSATLHKT